MSDKLESEFGRGLVICLVKFAEHCSRWKSDKQTAKEMRRLSNHPELFDMKQTIESHFNAASDHLYNIEIPKKWQGKEIGKKVKKLQKFGLEMGHGFTNKVWIEEDYDKAYRLCREIALLIDKELGLKPELGQW